MKHETRFLQKNINEWRILDEKFLFCTLMENVNYIIKTNNFTFIAVYLQRLICFLQKICISVIKLPCNLSLRNIKDQNGN